MVRITKVLFASMAVVLFFGLIALGQNTRPVADPKFSTGLCPAPGLCIDGEVVRVIDGDTLVVQSVVEYHVRLLDCWAPESRSRDRVEKVKGLKSKARMEELVESGQVRVLFPTHSDVAQMMTMGRLLGRVWVRDGSEVAREELSAVMVREGFATQSKEKQ